MDTWLVRGSHIAQVGLFVLTLWALFYTVIPLYKTAALEEQIARREAELKTTEQRLAETVATLNDATERAYDRSRADILWNLNYQAGPSCSGLFRLPEEPIALGDKPGPERPLLDINVDECLTGELAKLKPQSVLRDADLLALHAAVDQTAASLEKQRSDALAAMRQMETKNTDELYAFAPKGPFVQQMDAWFDKVRQANPGLPMPAPQKEHARAVRNVQEKIASDFEEQVRIEIRKLQDIAWPEPSGTK
ncbi:hypothetical protein [Bordetella bronchiseptica]|uniref:hypothetical protein n=1 Tax=Bordetella bronchiseptica TaxID=518 RepID=UPI001248361C|nr:hypothetical protein [Bordetella bronchiseptica]KAB1448551.1 hypothetical protein F7D00_08445 [Bordetella bronchiseptica]KAB1574873.1 hypothetical protein F7890_08445 [Bordetella bronchiseptica]